MCLQCDISPNGDAAILSDSYILKCDASLESPQEEAGLGEIKLPSMQQVMELVKRETFKSPYQTANNLTNVK